MLEVKNLENFRYVVKCILGLGFTSKHKIYLYHVIPYLYLKMPAV